MNLLLLRFPSILTTLESARADRDQFRRLLNDRRNSVTVSTRAKRPSFDLHLGHRTRMLQSGVTVFVVGALVVSTLPDLTIRSVKRQTEQIVIQMDDIPETRQVRRPPPPPRPAVPIETESEDVPDDVTIESTDLDFDDVVLDLPPPPSEIADQAMEDEPIEVWAVEEKPKAITRVVPKYPLFAQKAGIEGTVLIRILLGKDGRVKEARVMNGKEILRESALEAVKQYVFTPARQNDRPVQVWMAIPIRFRLRD